MNPEKEFKISPELPQQEKIEESFEKEKDPEKLILFIRHPSIKWIDSLLAKADQKGEDIETYVPIDQEGLKMTRLLSQYFQERLPDIIEEEDKKQEFTIYTSPIKRSKSMANIVSKNLKLAHTENPEIPIPKSNLPMELDYFAEAPLLFDKEEIKKLTEQARKKRKQLLEILFERDPEKVITILEEHREKIDQGLEYLSKKSETPIDIVFTHKFVITFILWLIEQRKTGREDIRFTKEDFSRFLEISKEIPYTSITEITTKEGKFEVQSKPTTPHISEGTI